MTASDFGREAYLAGKPRTSNPYNLPGPRRSAWFTAWDAAKIAANLS